MQIKQLVWEKRRLRRAWKSSRSPSSKKLFNEDTRMLTKTLKQKEELAQRRYIEKLSPTRTKHILWRAHPNLNDLSDKKPLLNTYEMYFSQTPPQSVWIYRRFALKMQ